MPMNFVPTSKIVMIKGAVRQSAYPNRNWKKRGNCEYDLSTLGVRFGYGKDTVWICTERFDADLSTVCIALNGLKPICLRTATH